MLGHMTVTRTSLLLLQEMVLDKIKGGVRPRFLLYDIMQFEVSAFLPDGCLHTCCCEM